MPSHIEFGPMTTTTRPVSALTQKAIKPVNKISASEFFDPIKLMQMNERQEKAEARAKVK